MQLFLMLQRQIKPEVVTGRQWDIVVVSSELNSADSREKSQLHRRSQQRCHIPLTRVLRTDLAGQRPGTQGAFVTNENTLGRT